MELAAANKGRQEQLMVLLNIERSAHQQLRTAYEKQSQQLHNQKWMLSDYKAEAHFWETQFKQVRAREDSYKDEVCELRAQLKKREQQLFGRCSEKKISKTEAQPGDSSRSVAKKNRGQGKGSKGHGRRDYSHLPVVEEEYALSAQEQMCPGCGLGYEVLPSTEDSSVVELINVQAYVRRVKRKKY